MLRVASTERLTLVAGILLLAIAALTGFMQAREEPGSHGHALWRVAHAGGTAGGVQLIAFAAVVQRLGSSVPDHAVSLIIFGIAAGTWAFFIGPLLRALGMARAARRVNLVGACLAGPAYLALPLVLLR